MKPLLAFLALALFTQIAFAVDYEGDGKKYMEGDVFTCPSSGLTFHAPDLKSPSLLVIHHEDAPGISWQLWFADKTKSLQLSVTYTKIREGYPKTDAILSRTAAHIKENVLRDGGYVEWCGFLSEDDGKVFQCIIRLPGRGKPSTVKNKWLNTKETANNDVYVIRQYLVRDGYYLEYNLYIPQTRPAGTYDEEKLLDDGAPILHQFVEKSGLVATDERYKTQMKAFTRPKAYIRFVFEDPSRGP